MDENALKEAFARIKNDIFFLGNEISSVKSELLSLNQQLFFVSESLNSMKTEKISQISLETLEKSLLELKNQLSNLQNSVKILEKSKIPTDIPTHPPVNPTNTTIPSDNPTVPCEVGGLKNPILAISIGNRGVPTDRQTNQQTDNSHSFYTVKEVLERLKSPSINPIKPSFKTEKTPISVKDHIEQASNMLESLDTLKKEIRLKFKAITNQEMLVFTTIYQLEEAYPEGIEYRQIALKLGLSESSIRDYVQKLINKGISVDKIKINNKKICLKIPQNLKKIASLETLIKLREL